MFKFFLVFCLIIFSDLHSGYFEGEEKVLMKECLKFFEEGKLLNKYQNKYPISENVERSDEYYEIAHLGNYYNLLFGYKIYDKNIKYITGAECITINFDALNLKK